MNRVKMVTRSDITSISPCKYTWHHVGACLCARFQSNPKVSHMNVNILEELNVTYMPTWIRITKDQKMIGRVQVGHVSFKRLVLCHGNAKSNFNISIECLSICRTWVFSNSMDEIYFTLICFVLKWSTKFFVMVITLVLSQ